MILNVKVIPRAKSNRIQKLDPVSFKIHVTQAAEDDKANKAVIELLSKHLGCKKSRISIVYGRRSQNKTIQIVQE